MSILSPVFHPLSGLWMLGQIDGTIARPLTRMEVEEHIMREAMLRVELRTVTEQRDALAKVADRLLTDLENVVEGLDPEEAKQVADMRAIIDVAQK